MYGGRALACFTLTLAAVMIGAAYQALDEYEEMLHSRLTPLPPMVPRIDDETFQRWFGSALAKIATAEAAMYNAADQHMEACRRARGKQSRLRMSSNRGRRCDNTASIRRCYRAVPKSEIVLCSVADDSDSRGGDACAADINLTDFTLKDRLALLIEDDDLGISNRLADRRQSRGRMFRRHIAGRRDDRALVGP